MRSPMKNSQTVSQFIQHTRQTIDTKDTDCTHLDRIQDVKPSAEGCEDCLKTGDRWVHLRMCLICGYVGCCDNSVNTHARKHFHKTQHALIMSMEVGPSEKWIWCYLDEALIT